MAISAHSFRFKSIRFDLKTNFLSHMIFLFLHWNCKVYFYRICAFYRNIVHFCLFFLSFLQFICQFSTAVKEEKTASKEKNELLLLLKLFSMQNISITRMPIFLCISVCLLHFSINIYYLYILYCFAFVSICRLSNAYTFANCNQSAFFMRQKHDTRIKYSESIECKKQRKEGELRKEKKNET